MVVSNDIITVVHTLYNQVTQDIYAAGDSMQTLKERKDFCCNCIQYLKYCVDENFEKKILSIFII